MPPSPSTTIPSARERLIAAATDLIRIDGIRGVSADKVIAAAGVSKVTFYRHFPSKDDLIVAYLEREWDDARALADAASTLRSSGDEADGLTDMLRRQICAPGFRGCPFINAAAELPDRNHPAREVIRGYRAWLIDQFAERLRQRGIDHPEDRARDIMMLRDGAMVAGYLTSDTDAVIADLVASIRRIVGDTPR